MAHAPARTAARYVLPLTAVGRADVGTAGGKGANLGELVRAGFPVPDGAVITTAAYSAVVAGAGLAPALAAADDDAGAALRAAFADVDIPDDVRREVLDAHALLGDGPVAVRSSATAEDLPGAAFAGQQDTVLDVVGPDALLDAVRRCWGSLWTERAIAYRARRDVDPAGVRIAVVVQRMVPAASAGVLFTADPVTGERGTVVVEAARGLGEALVSGLVTPDRYVLGAGGRVRSRSSGGGHDELPGAVLAELAALGRGVEAHFGRPQDVEWAWADGRVWLLQARPMTALPPPPVRLDRVQRITGPQIAEYLPVRPYPLDVSTLAVAGPGRMVRRMLAEIAGLAVDFADVLPEVDGVVDRFVPPRPRLTWRVLGAPARNLPRIRRSRPAGWTRDPRFAAFDRGVRELAALDPTALDWPQLRRLPRRALDAMEPITDLRVEHLPRVGYDLARLRAVLVLLRRPDLFRLLVIGGRTRTEDANRALAGLADLVRADPALHRAFTHLDPADLIAPVRGHAGFAGALDAFLAEYGHRETASLLLVSSPTWGESPVAVLGLVKVLVTDPPAAPDDRGRRAEQELLAHPLVRRAGAGPAVLRVVRAAREGTAFREDTHFHATRPLPVLRRALLETGRRLAAAGVLRDADDVLHLRLEELEALDAEPAALAPADAARLRDLVRTRSARRAELAGVPLIAPSVLFPDRAADGDALVTGTPTSGGWATGPVRIVRDAADFGRLRSGDVLVCPYTNPAWTPLFQRAAAVVVDVGGVGSHAAIVAREHGIPAVMGTGTGTAVLVDGQRVTVDGDTGRVVAADGGSGTLER